MTDETTGQVAMDDPHPDPFQGNSVRLMVTRPIDVSQLQDELERRTKSAQVMVALSTDDPNHAPSKARPAVLFVSPGNISERVIRDVVDNHVPRPAAPTAGAPLAPEPTIDTSALTEDLQALVAKLGDGDNLKAAEISDLLRGLLGIETKV